MVEITSTSTIKYVDGKFTIEFTTDPSINLHIYNRGTLAHIPLNKWKNGFSELWAFLLEYARKLENKTGYKIIDENIK